MESTNISVNKIYDVLLITVPSYPDDETISMIQEMVLQSLEKNKAKGLIMDISTVEAMDSYFARTIAETAQMVTLMGGRTVIVGMRPGVAITTTQLGLTLGNAMTALDVDRALDMLQNKHAQVR